MRFPYYLVGRNEGVLFLIRETRTELKALGKNQSIGTNSYRLSLERREDGGRSSGTGRRTKMKCARRFPFKEAGKKRTTTKNTQCKTAEWRKCRVKGMGHRRKERHSRKGSDDLKLGKETSPDKSKQTKKPKFEKNSNTQYRRGKS